MKLKREQVKKFRHHLCNAPVTVNTQGKTRVRSKASVNRDMTALRAALNHAHAEGKVTSTMAWEQELKPIKNAGVPRTECLDRSQRRQLIEHAADDLARLLTGLSLLPLRPGALAALEVHHLHQREGTLIIGKDKHGKDRKIKLPAETLTMLAAQTKDKLPTAPLFSRANGTPWNKDAWKKPIRKAAVAAGLSPNVTAYTLRHSTITDLVTGGLDLLTVAKLAGTSVAMIERHYGHLREDVAARALAQLVL
jgi:integrase